MRQQAARESFSRIGYEEGKNLIIEWRADGENGKGLPALAEELVQSKVDLIVAMNSEAVAAVKQTTRSIPIVMITSWVPVEQGFVESLAHPGGNVTGTAWAGPEVVGKCLQILKEAVPSVVRIGVLWNPSFPFAHLAKTEADRATSALGMALQYFYVTRQDEFAPALERIAAARPDAIFVVAEAILISRARDIANFATQQKLVLISNVAALVTEGGLLYYGPYYPEMYDRTVSYVDRILRGAKPADLPVEQPSRYELIINAKTAHAIGYKIPQSLLLRADRLIE